MSGLSGQEQRDIGMARVEISARPSQKLAVKQAIQRCYQKFNPNVHWTTDEVHEELGLAGVTLKEGRLLGPLMKRAETAGMVERVVCLLCHRQETQPSDRPERHAGPQYIWRSTSHGYATGVKQYTYDDAYWNEIERQIKQGRGE
jgi:hypothetical protein